MSSTVVIRKRKDRIINLRATDLEGVLVSAPLDELEDYKNLKWGNYQLGVASELQKAGYKLTGCDMLFHDTVPLGSGLSSSAAIELATAIALVTLSNEENNIREEIDKIKLAKICQDAEHNFIGVKCGIMDQFASAMGKSNHAILLDCRSLFYRLVPFSLKGYKIVISNTMKKRSLAAIKYNERRSECEEGLEILKKYIPGITCLGDITIKQFEDYKHLIDNVTVRRRVEHVIYENDRVLMAVQALEQGNPEKFGSLMIQSHDSLRDLYEVTGEELDCLKEAALAVEGVLGSRMTGAGFGGCTISVVKNSAVETFLEQVGKRYFEKTGLKAEFYISEIGDGAREIKC
ncbi:MAG TPA: galactokinase [Clostridiaceae bacterium]|nr:galactokinase [Clostridiaceae bacterium]